MIFSNKKLKLRLKKQGIEASDQDVKEFLKQCVGVPNVGDDLDKVKISKLVWLSNVHAYHIDDISKNANRIQSQLTKFTPEEQDQLKASAERFHKIFKQASEKKV
jgi:hypothetical protein